MNIPGLRDEANRISELKNPFIADKVVSFSTYCSVSIFDNTWTYSGRIKFKNGETEGEQKFQGKDFAALLNKMEIFMSELAKEAK